MINNPVPIVKRMTGTKGFVNRTRLTSISSARTITALIASLLAVKRSPIERSSADATGDAFRGARAGFFWVAGSMYRRMNHRAAQPGVISSTRTVGASANASRIGAT